jgi:hypothetical protein
VIVTSLTINDCNGGLVVCQGKVALRFLNTKTAQKAIDVNVLSYQSDPFLT